MNQTDTDIFLQEIEEEDKAEDIRRQYEFITLLFGTGLFSKLVKTQLSFYNFILKLWPF